MNAPLPSPFSGRPLGGPVRAVAALAMCTGAASCAPMTAEAVQRACLERADAAAAPRGGVALGMGSGGVSGGIGLQVSHDYLMGRDPEQVYADCLLDGLARLEPAP